MKNIIITFFKVSGLTLLFGIISFLLLNLLFNSASFVLTLIAIFLGGISVCASFILIYLPIYHLNKGLFEQEKTKILFERFLPIAIAPVTTINLIFMISNPVDFFDADALFIIAFGYILTYFSFYQFIRTIKELSKI